MTTWKMARMRAKVTRRKAARTLALPHRQMVQRRGSGRQEPDVAGVVAADAVADQRQVVMPAVEPHLARKNVVEKGRGPLMRPSFRCLRLTSLPLAALWL